MNKLYNEPRYYRLDPPRHYEPERALLNRGCQEHLVELPQGQNYFQPTRRKHFSTSNKSEILENHIFASPEEHLQPTKAFKKQFQRNLETKDIQGATTNTLVSNVVKTQHRSEHLKQLYELTHRMDKQPSPNDRMSRQRQHKLVRIFNQQSNFMRMPQEKEQMHNEKRNINFHIRRMTTESANPQKNQSKTRQSKLSQRLLEPISRLQTEPMHNIEQCNSASLPQIPYKLPGYRSKIMTQQTIALDDPERKKTIEEKYMKRTDEKTKTDNPQIQQKPQNQPANIIRVRRLINPTYLSYGSPFSLAGNIIVRQ